MANDAQDRDPRLAPGDDAQYLDPRLAELYDALNPPDATTACFISLLASRHRVLDLGCGTGLLARLLAADGHTVTGVEPAAPMLAIARRHPGVEWLAGDARTLALGRRFDAVVMSGHVFQIFVEDAEIAAVLARAREHVEPGGVLVFDSRNPAARAWERWTPERSRRSVEVAGLGRVTVSYAVRAVAGDLVSFTTDHAFADGTHLASESTLRFLDADAIRERLATAGFAHATLYGDWDRSPFTPASPEIIAVAS